MIRREASWVVLLGLDGLGAGRRPRRRTGPGPPGARAPGVVPHAKQPVRQGRRRHPLHRRAQAARRGRVQGQVPDPRSLRPGAGRPGGPGRRVVHGRPGSGRLCPVRPRPRGSQAGPRRAAPARTQRHGSSPRSPPRCAGPSAGSSAPTASGRSTPPRVHACSRRPRRRLRSSRLPVSSARPTRTRPAACVRRSGRRWGHRRHEGSSGAQAPRSILSPIRHRASRPSGARRPRTGGKARRRRLRCALNHRRGGAPALGQLDRQPPAVVRVDVALEVSADDEGVDQLAGRLLADSELADQVGGRDPVVRHPPEHERAVPRQVVEPTAAARARMAYPYVLRAARSSAGMTISSLASTAGDCTSGRRVSQGH